MTELRHWLDERCPPAPPELRSAVDEAVAGPRPSEDDSVVVALDRATVACLEAALDRPGRVRESAFALRTADALLTYACEAALDADDPDAVLRSFLPGLLEETERR